MDKPKHSKYPSSKFKWWYCILVGMASIIDGLTMIFTLGWFTTNLQMKVCLYGVTKDIYRK